MRFALPLVLLCLGMLAPLSRAQTAPAEEKTFLDSNIGKLVKLDPTPIKGESLDKVFSASFYIVKLNMANGAAATTIVAARAADNLLDVSLPAAPADMPSLKSLLKPDFKLKTD